MVLYLEVLRELDDDNHFARVAMNLVEREPDEPTHYLAAIPGAISTMQPVSAILLLERFLQLAPSHELAESAQQQLEGLRADLPTILEQFICELPKDLPRVASVERILHSLKISKFNDVIRLAK